MAGETLYLVTIVVRPGAASTLREYERRAVPVMRRHGGDLRHVWRPAAAAGETPDEVHLLAFATPEGYASFRADPALDAYRPLRDAAVARATVLEVSEVPLATYLGAH